MLGKPAEAPSSRMRTGSVARIPGGENEGMSSSEMWSARYIEETQIADACNCQLAESVSGVWSVIVRGRYCFDPLTPS